MKNLVVGAGLTGAVIAERIATMLGRPSRGAAAPAAW